MTLSLWVVLYLFVTIINVSVVLVNLIQFVAVSLEPKISTRTLWLINIVISGPSAGGASISFLFVATQLYLLMRSYKETIMKLRQGKHKISSSKNCSCAKLISA